MKILHIPRKFLNLTEISLNNSESYLFDELLSIKKNFSQLQYILE